MIRYGPAGIPLSCKGRTLKDGIEDVHNLALTALEIQMVRPKTYMMPPDEAVGMTIREMDTDVVFNKERSAEDKFIIGIRRPNENLMEATDEEYEEIMSSPLVYNYDYFDYIYDIDTEIEETDDLILLPAGIAETFSELPALGEIAKRHDVTLSMHTPYYMDLGADPDSEDFEEAMRAINNIETIKQCGLILNALGGDIVVTNVGPYDPRRKTSENDETEYKALTDQNIIKNLKQITKWWSKMKIKPRLGIEITGQQDVFGSLEQVLELCSKVKGLTPVLNFPHYQARYMGALKDRGDFIELIKKFEESSKGCVYASFSNVESANGNEKWLTPLKKGEIKFERLAEALAELRPDITLISSSPLMEHDAVYMKTLTERQLSKNAIKSLKDKKKQDELAMASVDSVAKPSE